jgi:hypothetical protein
MSKLIIGLIMMIGCGLALLPAHSHFTQAKQINNGSQFQKLNLQTCTQNICIEIKADKASQSMINGGIAFDKANVRIENVQSNSKIAKFVGAGYYDARSEKIFFSEITNSKFKEAYFDKLTGTFTKL